jgi:hypothetical protein
VSRRAGAVAACGAVALASLVLPAGLGFDPWAWLLWGREALHLDLDTASGPSWKPLPVLLAVPLGLAGDLGPAAWLVFARAVGLLLVVATFRVAARLAGPLAGTVAVVLLVLSPDGEPRFLRLVAEAHTAPLVALLVLGAVTGHLHGRHGWAFGLGLAVALDRPEAWPFLGCYGLWLAWRRPDRRVVVGLALVAVPVLWFGGDWWGSGDPWHGAEVARVSESGPVARLVEALAVGGRAVALPAWIAAAAVVWLGWRRRDRLPVAFAVVVVGWSVLVVAMAAAFGYAALSRFFLPIIPLVCVLAGVAVVGAARAGRLGALAIAVALPFLVPRVLGLPAVAEEVVARGRLQRDLPAAIASAGGRRSALACGQVAVDGSSLLRSAVAWHLEAPFEEVVVFRRATRGATAFVVVGGPEDRLLAGGFAGAELVGRSRRWGVYRVGCSTEL